MMSSKGNLADGTRAGLRRFPIHGAVRALGLLALAWFLQAAVSSARADCTAAASAGELAAQPCLTTLVTDDVTSGVYKFSALDLASAQANDAAYASLLKTCGPAGKGCNGSSLLLFTRLRNLEDNADELLGFGETQYSLHLPAQLLGNALRWTADEEYSAQSSLTNRYASNQFAGISSRLSALRFIAQTQHFASTGSAGNDGYLVDASTGSQPFGGFGGGASADDPLAIGKWSVYANGVYDAGSKEPTTFNDAFSFAGTTTIIGGDVRLSRNLVVGLMGAIIQQHADFDSSESIVGGNVKGSGGGLTAYLDADLGDGYLDFSVGGQRISLDTRRVVTYGSNNPQVSFVDTTLTSSTNATSLMATAGGGYSFYLRSFSATPYLNWQFLRTHIGAFHETASGTDPEFATSVNGQRVVSLISIAGLKFQYAWSLPFGVLMPYAYGEYRHEFKDHSQLVESSYSTDTSSGFQLPTDSIDPNYYEVGGGLMGVLARHTQIYVQYMRLLQLQYYSDYGISGGVRFQF